MTSRSIQTEARTYQNEHGVPYAEALRHVREARGDHSTGQSRLVLDLGTGVFPETGLTAETATPLNWTPGENGLPGDGSGSLCVYSQRDDETRSLYLASLVEGLSERPVVVFTERPELYPSGPNVDIVDPAAIEAIMQGTAMPENAFPGSEVDEDDASEDLGGLFDDEDEDEPLSTEDALHWQFSVMHSESDGSRVFVYDLTPCRSAIDENLKVLFETQHAALLYVSADLDAEGNPLPWISRFSEPGREWTQNEVTVFIAPEAGRKGAVEGWVAHHGYNTRLSFRG